MLAFNTPILAADISSVSLLKAPKIFLLVGHVRDRLVIKCETVEPAKYKAAKAATRVIAPEARLKILQSGELQQLVTFGSRAKRILRENRRVGEILMEHAAVDALNERLGEAYRGGAWFVKMQAQKIVNLDGVMTSLLSAGFEEQREQAKVENFKFATAFHGPDGLEKLGRIVAIDLFTGNQDRFSLMKPGEDSPHARFFDPSVSWEKDRSAYPKRKNFTILMKCLRNAGNVFITFDGNRPLTGALDFVDPASKFGNIDQPLADGERESRGPWPGRTLVDPTNRRRFAADVIDDLEALLTVTEPDLRPILGSDAAQRLDSGMQQGTTLIIDEMFRRLRKRGRSQGVEDRLLALGQAATLRDFLQAQGHTAVPQSWQREGVRPRNAVIVPSASTAAPTAAPQPRGSFLGNSRS